MRQFKQRVPSTVLMAISIFFLILVMSGIYGFIYIPQDEIEIHHILLALLMSFIIFIYSQREIIMQVDEEKHELSILENDEVILDAKIESDLINVNLSSAKYSISEYRVEKIPKIYRYNLIIPKSKELVLSTIFLKEISK